MEGWKDGRMEGWKDGRVEGNEMKQLCAGQDDFETVILIYAEAEGGRRSPPFNGIRWDFEYADYPQDKNIYMIWPDFHKENGDSLPTDQPLPIDVWLPARMMVLVEDMREKIHRSRIHEGTRFYCVEGRHRVAEGRVTQITGLFTERKQGAVGG